MTMTQARVTGATADRRQGARSCNRPVEPPDCRDLPHPVTFFMTGRERSRILRALRRIDGDRVFALKRALGLA